MSLADDKGCKEKHTRDFSISPLTADSLPLIPSTAVYAFGCCCCCCVDPPQLCYPHQRPMDCALHVDGEPPGFTERHHDIMSCVHIKGKTGIPPQSRIGKRKQKYWAQPLILPKEKLISCYLVHF